MNMERTEIRKNIEENKKEIVQTMKNDLNYFVSMRNSEKEFTITFPIHDVKDMLDCMEERMYLNCETEWEGTTAYYALSDYMYRKISRVCGEINVVNRPKGSSIYEDSYGHSILERKIDKSIQSILDTEIYGPCSHDYIIYYIVPPNMVNQIKESIENEYRIDDYRKSYAEWAKELAQEQIHEKVVRFFEEILNQKSADTLEEIQKRKNELIEELYILQQKEKEYIN